MNKKKKYLGCLLLIVLTLSFLSECVRNHGVINFTGMAKDKGEYIDFTLDIYNPDWRTSLKNFSININDDEFEIKIIKPKNLNIKKDIYGEDNQYTNIHIRISKSKLYRMGTMKISMRIYKKNNTHISFINGDIGYNGSSIWEQGFGRNHIRFSIPVK